MGMMDFEKWLEPIERFSGCAVFAHQSDQVWLYCHPSLQSEAAAAVSLFNKSEEDLEWTLLSVPLPLQIVIGIRGKGKEAMALLEILSAYLIEQGSPMSRSHAFQLLAANHAHEALASAKNLFYTDQNLKVWVILQSDQPVAQQMEQLLQTLGHEDVTAQGPNRVALMLHVKRDVSVLELIEGMHSLLEEDLFATVRIGISQPFSHYEQLAEIIGAAECALTACRLTVDKRPWCFADRDLLPMLLANPGREAHVIGAIDKRGLRTLIEDGELINTLEYFLRADLNTSEAATKLFIHRNTLLYRLAKIEKLTGLDPRCFADAMNLFAMVSVEKVSSGV